MNKKKGLTLTGKRAVVGLLFISPWIIGFLAFYVRSFIMTIQFALSEVTITPGVGGYSLRFVALENFVYEFTKHPQFSQTLVTSLQDILIDVPLIVFFSLFMALLLNKKFPGRTLVRAIFFIPVIMNADAIVSAIEMARSAMMGGVSSTSAAIAESSSSGVNMEYYLSLFKELALPDSLLDYVVGAIGRISDIISASGVQIVIFIAALQSIPSSLYEVAKIEGATGYETFWKVTFPMVLPHIITNIVYTVVDSFTNSQIVDMAYETAYKEQMWGLSSAMSLTTTVLVCVILGVVCGLIQKRTFYYN
ncbi:MAG: sugar ABC transporter permease [Lachnospiraceae bacterium]|jgi:ABC-type sugar transport system permease subunit|nr:sugar ABC transporter permease [Lachnospiraceae bacterium]MCX4346018.1 sugar ABC transporter permease [Lachnospiraceae bacterium]